MKRLLMVLSLAVVLGVFSFGSGNSGDLIQPQDKTDAAT